MKNRARYKNIINKSKGISKKETVEDPFDLFVKTMPTELDYYKDSNNYRLKAAWKAYGKPKDVLEAWYEGLIDVDRNKLIMPSIGYNEETDSYEYLNTGKDNDVVNKDIRVWENDTIPFVKELKNGGYIRTFNEELNCWMYRKNTQSEEIESYGKGNKVKENIRIDRTSPEDIDDFEMFLTTLPSNQRNYDPNIYNMRRYWELNGKPKTFWEAVEREHPMFSIDPNDYFYHAGSVSRNENGDYEFMKAGTHNTTWMEEAWYNGFKPVLKDGKKADGNKENYDLVPLTDKELEESQLFKNEYDLIKTDSQGNPLLFWKYVKKSPQAFKQGGQMNIIPEGALHARKNNMKLAKEGEITHKGIPVIDKDGGLVAEVEKEEITFTKPVTEKLEDWYKKFYAEDTSDKEKDELAIKCGKFIAKEILFNTDDRVGLIEKIKELEGL